MARKKQSRGACVFCGKEMTKGGLTRHLNTCQQRQEATTKADRQAGKVEPIYHLQVQDAWNSDFWLYLEMRGSASLKSLDEYLRAIWLECCGHLSHFAVGGGWGGQELPMSSKARMLFQPGLKLTHLYDYGTTSETKVTVTDVRQGKPLTKHPITLLARNFTPDVECQDCGEKATWLCMECVIEHNEPGYLCDEHAEDHPHVEYGDPAPLVNSPRLGMCGYYGPADPPY
ncbi:MAG: hypothetical protein ISS57_01200 [Anaerolineales bacterium]|nr:hypothetical protein [Anaerolineales bacterium]